MHKEYKMSKEKKYPSKSKKNSDGPGIVRGGSVDFAYNELRKAIVSLELAPGQVLDEVSLVKRFGVSRTPVREALVRLATENLVKLSPNRGARVTAMDWTEIREHLETFEIAQRLVNRWAAIRRTTAQLAELETERDLFREAYAKNDSAITPEYMVELNWQFHATIARACANSRLERFYLLSLTENLRISYLAMARDYYPSKERHTAHMESILREHCEMVDAIRDRNADRSEALARSHTTLARKRVSETLTESLLPGMDIDFGGNALLPLGE